MAVNFILPIRAVQLLFAIIVLGLSGFGTLLPESTSLPYH